ncbi:DUF1799 domain-containing protein [Stenotrophomonas sp. MMGLT7]|nr:DUF1799 domain-containing protein [Stenotrophomonas sp. MMGLT7]
MAFLRCRTQWNYAPSGVPTGLRYGDCMAILRALAGELGIARGGMPQLLADLQAVEHAVVTAVGELREREELMRGKP